MKYKKFTLTVVLFLLSFAIFSQRKGKGINITGGYGLAGSFFVRSYEENQVPWETSFFKKNFVGSNIFFELEVNMKKNYSLGFHYSRQSFSKPVVYKNQFGNVVLLIDEKIRHFNNIWGVSLNKYFTKDKNSFTIGLGPYYIIPQQQEISIIGSGALIDIRERNQKNNNLNEAGAFVDFSYNYQFQPKVEIGVKSQFYYTISGNYAESITLFPYVKLKF